MLSTSSARPCAAVCCVVALLENDSLAGLVWAAPGAFAARSLAAYAAFFLSGASSLIFQTIWTRMLNHVFGAAPVAISTVLTVFMGGLGLGAWLGGKYAHRIKHPIITYAIAEVGVGIWGLLIPLLVRTDGWLATVNEFLRAELGAESGMFMAARFLCVAPILIVAAFTKVGEREVEKF